MSFKSVLDDIGNDAKKVFGWLASPTGKTVVAAVEGGAEAIAPQITGVVNIVNSWLAEIFKTQALATAAGATTGSSEQKAAVALSSITPQVIQFAQQYGLNTPTAADLNWEWYFHYFYSRSNNGSSDRNH
jgi:hypothetical protein